MRKETTNTAGKIDQLPPIDLSKIDPNDREGTLVIADPSIVDKDYQAELAFMAEWVKIRIAPSAEQNAPQFVQSWTNGKPAEILENGQPRECKFGALPIGHPIL